MELEDLERYLERGDTLGFKKETGADEYLSQRVGTVGLECIVLLS